MSICAEGKLMRFVVSVFVAFVVVVISTSYVLANWEYEKNVDEFDGFTHHIIQKSNCVFQDCFGVFIFCYDYPELPPNTVPNAVTFIINDVLDPRSKEQIRLKFDANKPEYLNIRYLNSDDTDIIGTKTIIDFKDIMSKMQRHTTMKLEYYLYPNNRQIKTIDLEGFTKELNKFPSSCR